MYMHECLSPSWNDFSQSLPSCRSCLSATRQSCNSPAQPDQPQNTLQSMRFGTFNKNKIIPHTMASAEKSLLQLVAQALSQRSVRGNCVL